MKKKLLIILCISLLIIITKYYLSNYEIKYEVDGYQVYTKYSNKRFYIEVKKNDITYNFDIYSKRKTNKTKITKIEEILIDDYACIYPEIINQETYPLCYDKNKSQLVDFNLIDSELLDNYKISSKNIDKPNKDFVFYNNLDKNAYVALWTYKGYIIMNGSEYSIVDIFEKDRYDNNLSYIIDNKIFMPNYDDEYEYKSIVALNITNGKVNYIDIDYSIDYDSYIVGNINNKLYVFDNKAAILYEINTSNGNTKIISNNEIGYVKYENGKFVSCSKNEYKIDKITFSNNDSNYSYEYTNNSTIKIINDNKDIKIKISNNTINNIYEEKNNLYYIYEDSFYKYSPIYGSVKIFYDYELKFNNSKSVFMYYK